MNNKLLMIVVMASLVMPIASAQVTVYFDPQDSSVPDGCNTTYVKLMLNITEPDSVRFGDIFFNTDATCVNVTDVVWGPQINPWITAWHNENTPNPCADVVGDVGYDYMLFGFYSAIEGNADVEICNMTIHCNCSTGHCTSPLNFGCGALGCASCPFTMASGDATPIDLYPDNVTLENGIVVVGGVLPSAETFSKDLYEGWNLISLPLDPKYNTASAVLSGASYDAVYRYNATAKQFEGIESADAMNPGTGYFVHATSDCIWNYSGYAYNSMDASLEQGLNMVGWLNCSKGVGDALSSISDKYYYVARWNTSAGKFEVYTPVAPTAFDDFTTMDRGTGYFVSAKQERTLSESC